MIIYSRTQARVYVSVHRAPGHFFQLAVGRVNGEALEIRRGRYSLRMVKAGTFT